MSAPAIRLYEIYDAFQGESTLVGTPCTLVRLAGCPLRCDYCDTAEALPPDSGEPASVDEIVARVVAADRPLTLVTGGEPLAQRRTPALLAALADVRPLVQLETSGALDIRGVDERVRRILDIKTPGSGEAARNRWENLADLRDGDEIKFVLTGRADYEWALGAVREHRMDTLDVPLLFSPAWGALAPDALAGWMLADRAPARLQIQQHKYIWGAEAKGV